MGHSAVRSFSAPETTFSGDRRSGVSGNERGETG
jgi:hypothetical protein